VEATRSTSSGQAPRFPPEIHANRFGSKARAKTNWIQQADNALKRAAKRAREVAVRTNTPLHVMRDGRIVKLMPGAGDMVLRKEPPAYGGKKP
jgi:hypothetical protein